MTDNNIFMLPNPYIKVSESHGKDNSLRNINEGIGIWYDIDSQDYMMKAMEDKNCSKTVACNFNYNKSQLPNLWFDDDINNIIMGMDINKELENLLCSQISTFKISKKGRIKPAIANFLTS